MKTKLQLVDLAGSECVGKSRAHFVAPIVLCLKCYLIDHFTVIWSVTWPWDGSEAAGDFVLIGQVTKHTIVKRPITYFLNLVPKFPHPQEIWKHFLSRPGKWRGI